MVPENPFCVQKGFSCLGENVIFLNKTCQTATSVCQPVSTVLGHILIQTDRLFTDIKR
jgi:hypothetical protein